ncbi:MAG: type IV toxin-antitoxin system AbiEi family antitoxin domain-containing protein [Actinomycetota bacterium]|nr:type IV toxin-antitoxin system AbiEi family antitoxin domain-containing protein [Actinomycetota bacterium]
MGSATARSARAGASHERAALRLALARHGIVTRAQLLEAGASHRWIADRLRRGWLEQLHKGVFRVATCPLTWEARAAAALAAAGARAVLCRTSAARVLELDVALPRHEALQLLLPDSGPRPGVAGAVIHRSRAVPAAEQVRVGSLRLTSPARTIVDLSAELGREALERLVDDALLRGLVSVSRVDRALLRLGSRGRPGASALRDALAVWRLGRLESVAESRAARLLLAWGLPAPVTQFEVFDAKGGLVGRLDFAWPDRQVGLEVDGFAFHGDPRSFTADRERQNRLVALGWTIVRTAPRSLGSGSHSQSGSHSGAGARVDAAASADTLRRALERLLR